MTGSSCGEVVRSILRSHCDHQGPFNYVEVFLDFENAVPTEQERHLFDLSDAVLAQASQLLENVSCYGKGASSEIRTALQNPQNELAQEKAVEVVSAYVSRIKSYYELSLRIEKLVPQLLWDLCSGPLPPEEQLDARQALARQLARIVDFVLEFDSAKMCTPALQNDFSFYRRLIGRNEQDSSSVELANSISLFLAAPTPMLSSLSSATTAFVRAHPTLPLGNTTDTLATIVSVCCYMVTHEEAAMRLGDTARLFCVRVMVGCLILYDHVDEQGAFVRDSPINVKTAVQVIRQHTTQPQTDSLLNSIRYTTKHFNQESTPKSIRQLLA
ncbi:unnamed protein product, partial [Mesorhabditis belari]|uniref:CYRIA/CYRIB Rac1 binding domain-containing protein n=1 Tax=Mesorhabditis belari TaxID=2138241 RepID=A0AAF3ETZ8_9BILA